jgi:hypothetical protein
MAKYTEAQRSALRAARAAGVTSVAYGGDKKADFRSLAEMDRILADMDAELDNKPIRRTFRVTTRGDKGL